MLTLWCFSRSGLRPARVPSRVAPQARIRAQVGGPAPAASSVSRGVSRFLLTLVARPAGRNQSATSRASPEQHSPAEGRTKPVCAALLFLFSRGRDLPRAPPPQKSSRGAQILQGSSTGRHMLAHGPGRVVRGRSLDHRTMRDVSLTNSSHGIQDVRGSIPLSSTEIVLSLCPCRRAPGGRRRLDDFHAKRATLNAT